MSTTIVADLVKALEEARRDMIYAASLPDEQKRSPYQDVKELLAGPLGRIDSALARAKQLDLDRATSLWHVPGTLRYTEYSSWADGRKRRTPFVNEYVLIPFRPTTGDGLMPADADKETLT